MSGTVAEREGERLLAGGGPAAGGIAGAGGNAAGTARPGARGPAARRPPNGGVRWLERHTHLLLVLPGMLLLIGLVAYPVIWNLVNSLTNRSLRFPVTDFVGLDNYLMLLQDVEFWGSVSRTLGWTVFSVAGQLLLGLIGAMALQHVRRGQAPLRIALLIPWAFPSIVLAFSWRFMLDGLNGVVNDVLMRVGVIAEPVTWLGNADTAMPAIIIMNVWFGFPFMMVALLAGLQGIPRELYESAAVDGANYRQESLHITLPALSKLIGSLVLLRAIWVFNNFDFVYLTTGGGPVNATQTLPVYAYQMGWANGQIGRMAAASMIIIAVLLLVGIARMVITRLRRDRG